jgi:uncharacterized oxidoreductase
MQVTDNTILITGGASGIGRALAEAFHHLGNHVIIAGRRQRALDAVAGANPGMRSFRMDISDPAGVTSFAEQVTRTDPALNILVNNASIMKPEDLKAAPGYLDTAQEIIATNLLGPIRLTAALLPHLQRQPPAALLTVSSDLAFVPMASHPTYFATKAAIHSYTMSLRHQLSGTSIEVIEIIPPYVQTELMGGHQLTDERAMPLDAFISETMQILSDRLDVTEVVVGRCEPFRFAAENNKTQEIFHALNVTHALG